MSYAQLFSPGSAYLDPSNPLATPSWAGLAAGFDALGGGTDLLGQLAQNMGISSSVIAGLSGLTPRSTHGRRSQNHLGKADHSPRGGKSSAAANGGWGVDYASPVTKAGTKRSYSAAIRSEVEGRGSPMLNTESGLPGGCWVGIDGQGGAVVCSKCCLMMLMIAVNHLQATVMSATGDSHP